MQRLVRASWAAPCRRWGPAAAVGAGLGVVAVVLIHAALWPLLALLPATPLLAWLGRRPSSPAPVVPVDAGPPETEWYGLLAVECARTPADRRLALATEFLRLAGDLLRLPPTNRRRWPGRQRLDELRRQANLLLASAVDRGAPVPPDADEDAPTTPDLERATASLSRYAGLLAALATTSRWDAETLRLLTRERTRLDLAREGIARALREPRLPASVDARGWLRDLDAAS